MSQTIWCAPPWDPTGQSHADAIVGRRPAARSVMCVVGGTLNADKVRADIKGCVKDNASPILWWAPNNSDLDAGTVDVKNLPAHPSAALLVDILREYDGLPMLARPLNECANVRVKDGKAMLGSDGKPLLRYTSPAIFRTAFAGLSQMLPAHVGVALSYGPNGWAIDFSAWIPPLDTWQVGDCSQFGRAHRSLIATAGKNAQKFYDAVRAAKGPEVPFIVGECGFPEKDYAGLTGNALDTAMLADAKGLLGGKGWLAKHGALLLCGPYASQAFNLKDWTGDETPLTRDYIAQRLGNASLFGSLPLAAEPSVSPLKAAGLVKA